MFNQMILKDRGDIQHNAHYDSDNSEWPIPLYQEEEMANMPYAEPATKKAIAHTDPAGNIADADMDHEAGAKVAHPNVDHHAHNLILL